MPTMLALLPPLKSLDKGRNEYLPPVKSLAVDNNVRRVAAPQIAPSPAPVKDVWF